MRMQHVVYQGINVRISAWMAPGAETVNYRFGVRDRFSGVWNWDDVTSAPAVAPDVVANLRYQWPWTGGYFATRLAVIS